MTKSSNNNTCKTRGFAYAWPKARPEKTLRSIAADGEPANPGYAAGYSGAKQKKLLIPTYG